MIILLGEESKTVIVGEKGGMELGDTMKEDSRKEENRRH